MQFRRPADLGHLQPDRGDDMRNRRAARHLDQIEAVFAGDAHQRDVVEIAGIVETGFDENHRDLRANAVPLADGPFALDPRMQTRTMWDENLEIVRAALLPGA